jgi:DedD protein
MASDILNAPQSAALGFRIFAPNVDTPVKQRLTGAIVLVALIVLLVPALLNGPLRPAARGAAPPAEEPPLRTYTIDLADNARGGDTAVHPPTPSAPASAPASAPVPRSSPAPPAPARAMTATPTTSAARAATPAPRTAAAPATARAGAWPAHSAGAAGSAAGQGWTVQLGSFANRANAERLAQQLRARGFQVAVSRGSTGRHLYRVRAGPVSDRAGAERLAAKLRATGHRGAIVAP